jgi:hypothetical protein
MNISSNREKKKQSFVSVYRVYSVSTDNHFDVDSNLILRLEFLTAINIKITVLFDFTDIRRTFQLVIGWLF